MSTTYVKVGKAMVSSTAAPQAYRFAWCDGPPYAYHYGLENAKKHLRELGAPEPEMPTRSNDQNDPMTQ